MATSTQNQPTSFLPYHEPGIVPLLIQSSFLLILNIVNSLFDKLIFCGLLGQVFIGVAWGTPGAGWLGINIEEVITQLGYSGLILVVYEGGLAMNFTSLKANLFLSTAVAITGIAFPIALSFILQYVSNSTPLQAFAAGAALCSTSLGTTFTILSTSGLSATRLGTVLSSAAMMDDVVGLVMVQVISNLGSGDGGEGGFSVVTVVRPLAVSVGLGIAVPGFCWGVVRPLTIALNGMRKSNSDGVVQRICGMEYTAVIIHTLILIGLVTGATYAGTSNLFAAYLAGAAISWWDSEVEHLEIVVAVESAALNQEDGLVPTGEQPSPSSRQGGKDVSAPLREASNAGISPAVTHGKEDPANSGNAVFYKYYATVLRRILKPFFFASIGFAIPITQMFDGEIVWRGIVYTILMLFAKLVTGLWLVRLDISKPRLYIPKAFRSLAPSSCFGWKYGGSRRSSKKASGIAESQDMQAGINQKEKEPTGETNNSNIEQSNPSTPAQSSPSQSTPPQPPEINKPLSLYPAAMLGTAMTARGEIGFLIASLAETTGLFAPSSSETKSGSSEIYLVVTWAIVLCTIIGPLSVGCLVKRVRRLQGKKEGNPGRGDPLGIWGVA